MFLRNTGDVFVIKELYHSTPEMFLSDIVGKIAVICTEYLYVFQQFKVTLVRL